MRRVEAENSQVISCLHSWKINGTTGERETSFEKLKLERDKNKAGCGVDFLQFIKFISVSIGTYYLHLS